MMSDKVYNALIQLGDALDATDEVREYNGVGFNKADKSIWAMVRGNAEAMLIVLYKYQKQLRSRFPGLCDEVEWVLPEKSDEIMERAKGECREKRRAAKEAEREAREAEKRKKTSEPVVANVHVEVIGERVALDLITEGNRKLESNRFYVYLDATKALAGRSWDGRRWTVSAAAEFGTYKEKLATVNIGIVGTFPTVSASVLNYERCTVKVEFLDNGMVGIFHPYSERMNAAYKNAEETSGIIGWNASKKCRVIGREDAHDLREVLETIKKIHPDWTIGFKFDLDGYYAEIEALKAARRMVTPDVMEKLREGITPLPHQVEGYRFISQFGGNVLCGDDMGLGKTFQALLWAAMNNGRLAVVCPKNVRRQWLQECLKFFKDGVWKPFEIDTKTPTDVDLSGYNVVSINYEILHKFKDALLRAGFTVLVIDESHRIKNPKAKITQLVQEMAPSFQHKILMSGTPIKNKKKEIFTQANLVRPGTFRSMNEVAWMTTFAARETIKSFFFRRTKKAELPNLPPKLRSVVRIDGAGLPDYKPGMQIGEISSLRSRLAMAKVPMTCGFVEEILEGSDSKVIVFSESDDAAQKIAEHFGERAVLHVGSTPHEKREIYKAQFNDENNETVRVFVATAPSCKEGVNLTIADKVVFNDLPWTPADLNQAEDRSWRIGQKAECVNVYWVCAAENEFDTRAVAILFRKMEIYKKVIDGKKPTEEDEKFLKTPIDRLMLKSGIEIEYEPREDQTS